MVAVEIITFLFVSRPIGIAADIYASVLPIPVPASTTQTEFNPMSEAGPSVSDVAELLRFWNQIPPRALEDARKKLAEAEAND